MDLHEDSNKHGPDFSDDAQRQTEQSEGLDRLVIRQPRFKFYWISRDCYEPPGLWLRIGREHYRIIAMPTKRV